VVSAHGALVGAVQARARTGIVAKKQ
jgi:hypothetical protein